VATTGLVDGARGVPVAEPQPYRLPANHAIRDACCALELEPADLWFGYVGIGGNVGFADGGAGTAVTWCSIGAR
jgi:hypothetical protein